MRDADTNAALADVTIDAGTRRVVSDRYGRFVLRVPGGIVRFELTRDGFYPLSTRIDVTQGDAIDTERLLVSRSIFSRRWTSSVRPRLPRFPTVGVRFRF